MRTERGRRGHWIISHRQQWRWEGVVKRRGSRLPSCRFGSHTSLNGFLGQSCHQFGKISQSITLEQWNEVNFWDSIKHAAFIGRQSPLVWCCYSERIVRRDIIGLGKSKKFQWSWWGSKTENENTSFRIPPLAFWKNRRKKHKRKTVSLGFPFHFDFSSVSLMLSRVLVCPLSPFLTRCHACIHPRLTVHVDDSEICRYLGNLIFLRVRRAPLPTYPTPRWGR